MIEALTHVGAFYANSGQIDKAVENLNKLLIVVADALGRDLINLEKNFVENNFSKYRTKQNLDILLDPVAYYKQLKTQTYNMVKIGIA